MDVMMSGFRGRLIAVGALALAAACGADTTGPDTTAPAEVAAPAKAAAGDAQDARFNAIEAALAAEVDAGVRAGFVGMVFENGEVAYETALGMADREAGVAMSLDTRFRIASMTKPVVSVAALMLVDDGALSLDDPLSDFIPEFAEMDVATSLSANEDGEIPTEPIATPIAIRHLMTHTSGLGYVFDEETDVGRVYQQRNLYEGEGDLAARVLRLADAPLYAQPGTRWYYSYATDVLGRVVEIVSEQRLEEFVETRILRPLGMSKTSFGVRAEDFAGGDVAMVYAHDEAGALVPQDGGGLSQNLSEGLGWASGGSGLVSTAGDYMKFCRMLLSGGRGPKGAQLLSEAGVASLFDSQVSTDARPQDWRERGVSFSLGGWVVLANPTDPEDDATTGLFGWGGYYDTDFAVNRTTNAAHVVLSQRQPGPHDRPSRAHAVFRSTLYGADPFAE